MVPISKHNKNAPLHLFQESVAFYTHRTSWPNTQRVWLSRGTPCVQSLDVALFFLFFSFFPPFFFLLPLFFYTRIKQYPHSKHIEKHWEYIENRGNTEKIHRQNSFKRVVSNTQKTHGEKNTGARTKVWTRNALISPLPSATSCETVDLDLHHQVRKLCQWQTLTWKLGASIDETLGTNRISWNFLLNLRFRKRCGFNIFWLMSSKSSN